MVPADPPPDSPDALRVAALTLVLGYKRICLDRGPSPVPENIGGAWFADPAKVAEVWPGYVIAGEDVPLDELWRSYSGDPVSHVDDAMLLVAALAIRGAWLSLYGPSVGPNGSPGWRAIFGAPGGLGGYAEEPTPALAVTRAAVACARALNEREVRDG